MSDQNEYAGPCKAKNPSTKKHDVEFCRQMMYDDYAMTHELRGEMVDAAEGVWLDKRRKIDDPEHTPQPGEQQILKKAWQSLLYQKEALKTELEAVIEEFAKDHPDESYVSTIEEIEQARAVYKEQILKQQKGKEVEESGTKAGSSR